MKFAFFAILQLTYAGRYMGTTLLITTSTTITRQTSNAILTGTLTGGMITCFTRRAYRMTFTCCNERENIKCNYFH